MRMKSLFIFTLVIGLLQVQGQVDFSFIKSEKLVGEINTEYEETAPVFDLNSETLYFTRSLHPDNKGGKMAGQDIWMSRRSGGQWSKPDNGFRTLNNKVNNSVIGLSSKGDTLYLLSTYEKKHSLQKGFSRAVSEGDSWRSPVKLDVSGLGMKGEYYSGFVSNSGKYLIISMDGRSSLGKEDLYLSINRKGKMVSTNMARRQRKL